MNSPTSQRGRDFAVMLAAFNQLGYSGEAERLQDFPADWTKLKKTVDNEIEEVTDSRRLFFMGNALVTEIVKRIAGELEKIDKKFLDEGGELMAKSKKTRKAPRVVAVKKHTRKNGEVVPAHKRSKPDGIKSNNHSY